MLCLFLSTKTTNMTAKYTQNQAYPLENRLASFILLSSDHDFYKEKHTEVCEYLGVSYRHLLFVLAQFTEARIDKTKSWLLFIKSHTARTISLGNSVLKRACYHNMGLQFLIKFYLIDWRATARQR